MQSTDVPDHQRSWFIAHRGNPKEVLKLNENAPVPKPNVAAGEVLVKVHSVSLNPVGYKLMQLAPWPIARYPMIPEGDFSGTILAGENSGGWDVKQGDGIIGLVDVPLRLKTGKGAMAQYIALPAKACVKKPSNVDFADAAGLPTVGLTAYQGIITHGQVGQGTRIFINGGSTSVGLLAIQIAKLKGAHVVTSCSGGKADLVRSLGADEVLDYTQSPIEQQLAKLPANDVVFDCVGVQSVYSHCADFLKPNGPFLSISVDLHGKSTIATGGLILATIGNFIWPSWLGGVKRKFKLFSMVYDREQMQTLANWMGEGKLKMIIDSVQKSDREGVLAAFEKQMSNKAKGKIIVEMQ